MNKGVNRLALVQACSARHNCGIIRAPSVTPGMTEERTFLRDTEWASIDGNLCLVTEFVPLAGRIENGSVVAVDTSTPYASVRLKTASYDGVITGFITHKLDFAMLWAAFNKRGPVAGAHREFGPSSFEPFGAGSEEVWLVWTKKRYRWPVRLLFKGVFPKLIVMVSPEGAFESVTDQPGLVPFRPIVRWIPEVMLHTAEMEKLQFRSMMSRMGIRLLPEIWDAIQSKHSK
jgi:hypothetical protein